MKSLVIAALLTAAPQATPETQATPGGGATPAAQVPPSASATPAPPAAPATGAIPVTLAQVRAEGRKNTQALLALLDLERSEQDVKIARSPLLPQVSLSSSVGGSLVGRQRIFTTIADPTTGGFVQQAVEVPSSSQGSFNNSLNLQQILYDHARWKQLAQSGAVAEAARGQAQEQEDAAELEAINRFFNLYRSQATIQVLEATVKRSEEQLERARALFQAGRVGRGEELSAQVNLGNDRISLVQGRSQLVQNQSQLAVWLARSGTEVLFAQDPGVLTTAPIPAPALEAAITEAHQRRPLIVALQQQVRAAELGREATSAAYYPRLVGQATYSRSGPSAKDVFTEARLQNTLFGQVALQWDVFSGLSTTAQVARARATQRTAELNLEQAQRELDGTVRSGIELLNTRIEAARLAAENRDAAALSLALAEERFRAGAGSTLEVRDAQLKLTQSELTLLGNRVDVEIARFALMRAMGILSPGESQ